jgi:hypothetical protein
MVFRMLGSLGMALAIRRLGMIQGEALAWHHGAEGVRRAFEVARRHPAGSPEHAHALWVARFAKRRLDDLNDSDLAGKYELGGTWGGRRGSLICADETIR